MFVASLFVASAREILMGCSSGKAISGTSSSFFTNFRIGSKVGFFPACPINFMKASLAEIEVREGGSPPPDALMAALGRALHQELEVGAKVKVNSDPVACKFLLFTSIRSP